MNSLRFRNDRQLACHAGTTLEWLIATRNRRTSRKRSSPHRARPFILSQLIPPPETSIPWRPVLVWIETGKVRMRGLTKTASGRTYRISRRWFQWRFSRRYTIGAFSVSRLKLPIG